MTTLGIATLQTDVDLTGLNRGLNNAKSTTSKFMNEVGTGFSRQFGVGVADVTQQAAAAVVDFVKGSAAEFSTFQKGMSEVFTLMPGMSAAAMSAMKADVLDFATEAGRTTDEVIPGIYEALSSGVPADNVFDFMKTASDAALGGVTDLDTVVNGLTSVINSYGSDVISAAEASDVMFMAVKLGKTTFEELSNSLYNVIPTATSLGVSFEDVAANLAAMTAQGVPTSVATTQLRQAFVEASKSGTKLDEALQQLTGKTFQELIASGSTSAEIFGLLRESMPEQQFRDLFGSVEASNAAMLITSSTADNIIGQFGTLEDTLGSTAAAAATMADTIDQSNRKLASSWEALKIAVGDAISPMMEETGIITQSVDYLRGAVEVHNQLREAREAGNVNLWKSIYLQNMYQLGLMSEEEILKQTTNAAEQFDDRQADVAAHSAILAMAVEDTAASIAQVTTSAVPASDSLADLANGERELSYTTQQAVIDGRTAAESLVLQSESAALTADALIRGIKSHQSHSRSLQQLTAVQREAITAYQDYASGAVGANLTDEERTRILGELDGIIQQTTADIAAMNAAQGDYFVSALNAAEGAGLFNETLSELDKNSASATINQNAVNQAIFDAADAAGASGVQLALLGGALGLYSDEAVEAALKSALIQEKINQLSAAYVSGEISVSEMRAELQEFIQDVDTAADGLIDAAKNADAVSAATINGAVGLNTMAAAAETATTALNNIPTDITVNTNYTQSGTPPSVPGGSQGGGGSSGPPGQQEGFAFGGYTGPGNASDIAGYVHKRELVVPESAISQGLGGIVEFAQKHVPNLPGASAEGGGGASSQQPLVIHIDARGANPDQVQMAVEKAIQSVGLRVDQIRRSR